MVNFMNLSRIFVELEKWKENYKVKMSPFLMKLSQRRVDLKKLIYDTGKEGNILFEIVTSFFVFTYENILESLH